ncbi:PRA1-domain-containing protein [Hypoxylon cercidicola]|nr:PRA1-domain-containing protein [Hypoxylon cercidicola]
MARIQIPLDILTSRLNIQDRFAGFRNTSLSSRFANMRPVSEFLDFKRFSKPANFGEVQSRVNYNLGTFSSNYALVFVLLSIYALITNPLLLFDIVLLIAGLWLLGRLNGQDLIIGTFHATSSQMYTDEGDSTEDDSQVTSEEDTDDENQAARRELDEALVQSALARIRKAQAKGKQDVKLNKQELAALERRRKRLEAEAEAKRRGDGDRRQRKEKEQRYAVPLSHFDGPPRNALPPSVDQAQQLPGPPMGRFPPPNATRARPRSGTSSTNSTYRAQSQARDSSPFDYQYVHAPPNQRQISDPTARPSSSRLSLPREDEWRPSSSSSREYRDPFQYQTAGPQAPYINSVAAARLNATGSSDPVLSTSRKAIPAAVRSSSRRPRSRHDRNEQELEDDTTSDEGAAGAKIARDSSREEIVVDASPSPESERPKAKKTSSSHTPTKRKSGGKKRKGK